jgi:hypothetical protein
MISISTLLLSSVSYRDQFSSGRQNTQNVKYPPLYISTSNLNKPEEIILDICSWRLIFSGFRQTVSVTNLVSGFVRRLWHKGSTTV